MARKKKKVIVENVAFTGIADRGKSVGRNEEGRVFFAQEVAPGDVADILIIKKKREYREGVPVKFHKYSEERVEPFCEHFGSCGGCKWQHLDYEFQAKYKQEVVENNLKRIGKIDVEEFLPLLKAKETVYYRNKLEFAFSNKRWLEKEELNTDVSNVEDVLGFHRSGAFDKIININHCWLQSELSNKLRNAIKEIGIRHELPFFDIRQNSGFLRHILIRTSTLGELMLIVSIFENDQKRIKPFLDEILEQFPEITTLIYTINAKQNDFLLDLDMITYHGPGYIQEKLGHVLFKIGPKSFFQTNTHQAKELYDIVVNFADFQGNENVYDLYTGLGSIALYIAEKCKQVVGIEEIEAAIEDARKNAALNGIDNAVFYAGDVKNILTESFAEKHGKPDLLITDPPRAGMHEKVVMMLLELAAPKMVYVSCNPATQARDLNLLKEKYDILKVQPVDMFPHTHHIENVALLKLREG
jgi:23S rRNA (uracil1939-C5)-methyltransferase